MMKISEIVKITCLLALFSVIFPSYSFCSANLTYDSYTWTEVSGNGDSSINAGETIKVNVKLKNTGDTIADGVYAWLYISDSSISGYYSSIYNTKYSSVNALETKSAASGGVDNDGSFKLTIASDATSGKIFTFVVYIKNSIGTTWTSSFSIKISGSPQAPSGFKGVAQSMNSILWSWTDNADDETGFTLHRDSSSIAALAANSTTYEDTGLSPNTKYSAYVSVNNASGSTNSNNATVYTLANSPTELKLNGSLIESCVVLSWNGNNASRFAIERALDSGGAPGTWTLIKQYSDNISSQAFIDTRLEPGTNYWYRVKSYNGDGIINNTSSNESKAVTLSGSSAKSYRSAVYNNLINPTKNQAVYIMFDLPNEEAVTVTVYSYSGQEIKKILSSEKRSAGVNIVEWDGKNNRNEAAASGSYLVLIKAGSFVDKKKILVVK